MDEGCLTYPGVWLKVKRPYAVLFEYEDEKGEKHQKELVGLPSRIFQHEYDHIKAVDFRQRATRYHMEKAKKNMKLMARKRKRNAA